MPRTSRRSTRAEEASQMGLLQAQVFHQQVLLQQQSAHFLFQHQLWLLTAQQLGAVTWHLHVALSQQQRAPAVHQRAGRRRAVNRQAPVTATQPPQEAAMAAQAEALREIQEAQQAAERRAASAEARAAAAEALQAAAEGEARAAAEAARLAEVRAAEAEARALAAEDAVAEALLEVQRAGERHATFRATLEAIREAGHCPILQDYCQEPVVASDGHTYSRHEIESWLSRSRTSPMTRRPLDVRLYPNRFATKISQLLAEIGMGPPAAAPSEAGNTATPQTNAQAQDAAAPDPGALLAALEGRDEARALELLRRQQLPGLNHVDQDGRTVLHVAIDNGLAEAAVAVAARQDFALINARTTSWRRTALHQAAFRGYMQVCWAILSRLDFNQLEALDSRGKTAVQLAQLRGERDVVLFLGGR